MHRRAEERRISHDQNARSHCRFEGIAEHDGQREQHHHAAARALKAAHKPDHRTAERGKQRRRKEFRFLARTPRYGIDDKL